MELHGSEVADEFGFSRADQDAWALHSQLAAVDAMKAGRLDDEIFPIEIRDGKKSSVLSQDEGSRPETTIEGRSPSCRRSSATQARLPACRERHRRKRPRVNDGGRLPPGMSAERPRSLGCLPLCTILDYAGGFAAAEGHRHGPGPRHPEDPGAERPDLRRDRPRRDQQAFAAVVLVSARSILGMTKEEMFAGSASAGRHRLRSADRGDGARILMTLAYELRRRGGGLGVCGMFRRRRVLAQIVRV